MFLSDYGAFKNVAIVSCLRVCVCARACGADQFNSSEGRSCKDEFVFYRQLGSELKGELAG